MTGQGTQESLAKLELSDNSPLRTLEVFKDDPLFRGFTDDSTSDAFNHQAFADTIYKLIKSNTPPLSIGLFGSWGIGKTTIVNILFQKLKKLDSESVKRVYFNAWKYSGDSFRRQFLIEVGRELYGEGEIVARLEQLNYLDVLKRSHQQSLNASLKQGIKDAFDVKFAFRGSAVARFLIGCATLLLGVAIAAFVNSFAPLFAVLIMTIVVPAVFMWFSRIKFDELFIYQEAPMYDPKLIFPEQFEKEFAALVSDEALKGQKVVIVIDDLDRCEPTLVQDVLISLKNFAGHKNCFFIVPCDDKTIVEIFGEPNQKQGYRDESLRKYFNVGLRIPPIRGTDLVDFANTVARTTGIPEDVVQVAVLANCRDARKMKHFLNGFVMKYHIAKAREAAGLMPKIVDASLLELAKAVLIEDAYPDLFPKIVENPRLYHVLERAALDGTEDGGELKQFELEDWKTKFPGLKEILNRTRDIAMLHADVFFSLTCTNLETKVPRGTELRNAIVEANDSLVDEISTGITDSASRTYTKDMLVELLSRSSGIFLKNSIAGALRLGFKHSLFSPDDSKRLARTITYYLLYRQAMSILDYPSNQMLSCARSAGEDRVSLVLQKYQAELKALDSSTLPSDIRTLVAGLYEFRTTRGAFANLLNEKFQKWIQTREGLDALKGLEIPPDVPSDEKIPSSAVVQDIIAGIASGTLPMLNNPVPREIVFANWYPESAVPFVSALIKMLQNLPSGNDYSPEIEFAMESVLQMSTLVETSESGQLWNLVPSLWNRVAEARGRDDLSKVAVVFAVLSTDGNIRNAAKNFLDGQWRTFNDSTQRQVLDLAKSLDSPVGTVLREGLIQVDLQAIKSEREAPNDRTISRVALIVDYRECLAPNSIQDLFVEALEVSQTEPLKRWLEALKAHQTVFDLDFQIRLGNRCLELVAKGQL